jgi:hypothetical protein
MLCPYSTQQTISTITLTLGELMLSENIHMMPLRLTAAAMQIYNRIKHKEETKTNAHMNNFIFITE